MERTYIQDLHKYINKEVTISGWVDVRRDHGKLVFLDIRDRSGTVQVVVTPKSEKALETAERLRPEWVVTISGRVQKRPEKMINPDMPNGDIEFTAEVVAVLAEAQELPFDKDGEINLDTYLDYLPLTLRTKRARAIFKIQASIIQTFRSFLKEKNFIEFQAPKIIGEDAEGGASVFDLEYFNHTAHLAQSPQLYKQIMVGVYERVFTTGTVYRAEKHSTTRHLNEYTSLDIEMGFIKDHHDVMLITAKLMGTIMEALEKECVEELKLFSAKHPKLKNPIPHMKLREAQTIIKKEYKEDCSDEPDLTPQHERWISEYALKEFGSDFIFITHFSTDKRPMYSFEDPDDPGYTKDFDLLFRGLEINTGGQRVHDYDTLVAKMKRKNINPKKFSFYLQAFKYGMPPHGGFGMGLERLTARFLEIDNIKEAALFPREINRIDNLLSE